jgi:hypothetical protein
MRILGVDPGLSGGLVLLDNGKPVLRHVMPVIEIKKAKGKGTRREYDIPMLAMLIREANPDSAVIELQHAMPGQGGVSMFSIGLGYGILRGLVAGLSIPYSIVHAKTWGKVMFADCAKQDTKAMAAVICGRLWPDIDWRATERCKKAHEGLCDAALISEFGRRMLGTNV